MKATLDRARKSQRYGARLADVTAVTAGTGTVAIALSGPNTGLPALLDIPIVKETGGVPLGTGPYVLAGTGENLALEARSDWWQARPCPGTPFPCGPFRRRTIWTMPLIPGTLP